MTMPAVVLLGAAGIIAVLDWVAVARERKRLEYLAKPATLALLIAAALALDAVEPARQAWWVAALVFSLGGDVFLMLPGRFVPGLASFLVGHLAYVAGFVAAGVSPAPLSLVPVAAAAVVFAPRIVRGALAHDRRLGVPVAFYLVAISTMVVLALSAGPVAATGAGLFFASDAMIGFRNFVRERAWHDLAIIVTYHLGQALLVVSLTRSVA